MVAKRLAMLKAEEHSKENSRPSTTSLVTKGRLCHSLLISIRTDTYSLGLPTSWFLFRKAKPAICRRYVTLQLPLQNGLQVGVAYHHDDEYGKTSRKNETGNSEALVRLDGAPRFQILCCSPRRNGLMKNRNYVYQPSSVL